MVRCSRRQLYLKAIKRKISVRKKRAFSRFVLDEESEGEDEIDEFYHFEHRRVEMRRYIYRKPYRKSDKKYWLRYMDPTLTYDDEFREWFRCTRPYFEALHLMISTNNVFRSRSGISRRPQLSICLQLMCYLYYLSLSGSGAKFSVVGNKFHISKGAARDSFDRVLKAVLSLEDSFYGWPKEHERSQISDRFLVTHGFPDCIGCIDGTLINLSEKPEWMGHDFYHRKSGYAVHALVICDDQRRINYVYSGWVGSIHDNRALRNSRIKVNPSQYFTERQYLLGDSAFTADDNLIPVFKSLPGANLPRQKEFFNNKIAQARITIEHTIGILKNRFPCLKCMNIKIKKNKILVELSEYLCLVRFCITFYYTNLYWNKITSMSMQVY